MKKCSRCQVEKPADLENFPPKKKTKSGLGSWCRECHRKLGRHFYKDNADKKKAYQKQYRKDNADKINQYTKQWRKNNTDKVKEARIDRIRRGQSAYSNVLTRCNNPKHKQYKDYGGRGIKCLFADLADFQKTYFRTKVCEKCGCLLNDDNRYKSNGRTIHRVDNDGHYEEGNSAIICRRCHIIIHNRADKTPEIPQGEMLSLYCGTPIKRNLNPKQAS